MFSLIETLTGFAAIMLMLSLLVKTLTSVLKNYFDYYSDNLEHEVKRLVLATTGKAWDEILASNQTPVQVKSFAESIPWKRLGSEILNAGYLSWFLRQLDQNARVSDLESRLKIHVANVNYTFQMRMKNLALAVGLGMCLVCNINAFTIWKTLYTDQQLRATFADKYATKATELAEKASPAAASPDKAQLDAQMKGFQQNMKGFLSDVSFGVGRIWNEKCLSLTDSDKKSCQATLGLTPNAKETQSGLGIFFYEFFGSLLTGILVSIGAPYWHDILQALSSLRSIKPAAPEKGKA